jgi:hypothetical protein
MPRKNINKAKAKVNNKVSQKVIVNIGRSRRAPKAQNQAPMKQQIVAVPTLPMASVNPNFQIPLIKEAQTHVLQQQAQQQAQQDAQNNMIKQIQLDADARLTKLIQSIQNTKQVPLRVPPKIGNSNFNMEQQNILASKGQVPIDLDMTKIIQAPQVPQKTEKEIMEELKSEVPESSSSSSSEFVASPIEKLFASPSATPRASLPASSQKQVKTQIYYLNNFPTRESLNRITDQSDLSSMKGIFGVKFARGLNTNDKRDILFTKMQQLRALQGA